MPFLLTFERAALIGLIALVVALGAQVALERRVPAAWRVWIWRVGLLQTFLALLPLTPLPLAVLPASPAGPSTDSKGTDLPPLALQSVPNTPQTVPQNPIKPDEDLSKASSTQTHPPEPTFISKAELELILLSLYAIGVLVRSVGLVRSFFCVRRLMEACTPVQNENVYAQLGEVARKMKVSRLPRLREGKEEAPLLVGIFRPAIILPGALLTPLSPHLEAILSHELAHIKRRDLAWGMLQWFVQTLFWFHPISWASRHFLPLETESACDEMVLGSIRITPNSYGALLVDTMSIQHTPLTAGVNDGFAALKTRLIRLNHAPKRPRTWAQVSFVCALTVAMGTGLPFRFIARAQEVAPSNDNQDFIAKMGMITGRLVNPKGKRVSGARVSWVSFNEGDYSKGKVLATVKTDREGRFRFADSTALLTKSLTFKKNMPAGPMPFLFVEADGYAVSGSPVFWEFYSSYTADKDIQLVPETELKGTFVDQAGQPVPNVPVRVRAFSSLVVKNSVPKIQGGITPEGIKSLSTVTNEHGEFRFRGLPQAMNVTVAINDERFADLNQSGSLKLSQASQTDAGKITLVPATVVRGRVTNGDTGVAGVQVRALGPLGRSSMASTESDGSYSLKLMEGTYNLFLNLDEAQKENWTARAKEKVTVKSGESLQAVDFALERGVLITGSVKVQGTNQPIPRISLNVNSPAYPEETSQSVTTDKDGKYQVRVPAGEQRIQLFSSSQEYDDPTGPPQSTVPLKTTMRPAHIGEFSLQEGQNAQINWQLPKKPDVAPIQGLVVDWNGQPVPNAELDVTAGAFSETRDARGGYRREVYMGGSYQLGIKTDATGHFMVNQVRQPVELRAMSGQNATLKSVTATPGQTVTLRLQPKALVKMSVKVTDENGKPVPGASVGIMRHTSNGSSGSTPLPADKQGNITFASLWPDVAYSFGAQAPGYSQNRTEKLSLVPGRKPEVQILKLKKADSFVAGRLVNEEGKPLGGIAVSTFLSNMLYAGPQTTVTDEDGRFRFSNLVANEPITISASTKDMMGSVNVVGGNSDVLLTLKKVKPVTVQPGRLTIAPPILHRSGYANYIGR